MSLEYKQYTLQWGEKPLEVPWSQIFYDLANQVTKTKDLKAMEYITHIPTKELSTARFGCAVELIHCNFAGDTATTLLQQLLQNTPESLLAVTQRVVGLNTETFSPLYEAVGRRQIHFVNYLLTLPGVEEHINSKNGMSGCYLTPLHNAIKVRSPELILILLKHNADPRQPAYLMKRDGWSKSGMKTPMQIAKEENFLWPFTWHYANIFWLGRLDPSSLLFGRPKDIFYCILSTFELCLINKLPYCQALKVRTKR